MLAETIGLAVANPQLRDSLREMAMADPLTGLANRRQLGQVLETQIAQAAREGESLGRLTIDVDHFKRFNDVHGHEAGDAVLRAVGQVLANVTREPGVAFRYGGEEFLLLIPTADAALLRAKVLGRDRVEVAQLRNATPG